MYFSYFFVLQEMNWFSRGYSNIFHLGPKRAFPKREGIMSKDISNLCHLFVFPKICCIPNQNNSENIYAWQLLGKTSNFLKKCSFETLSEL